MKNKIKIITAFIIGGIIFGSIGVYGAGALYANAVKINTSNMSEVEGDTIQDALNYLYGKAQNNSTTCPEGFKCLYDFKVGDYIQITPTIDEFELTSAYTGSSTKQTIKPSELKLWRIIKDNDNRTYELVTDSVSDNITIDGHFGNHIYYLGKIASVYSNDDYIHNVRIVSDNEKTAIENVYGDLIAKNVNTNEGVGYFYDKPLNYYAFNANYYYYACYIVNKPPSGGLTTTFRMLHTDDGTTYNYPVSYGVRLAATLSIGVPSSGDGSKENPYILS